MHDVTETIYAEDASTLGLDTRLQRYSTLGSVRGLRLRVSIRAFGATRPSAAVVEAVIFNTLNL